MNCRQVLAVFAVCVSLCVNGQETVVTETEFGPVQGTVVPGVYNGEFNADVVSYYAVPFARAERFAKPTRDVTAWTEIRITNWTDAKACPQSGGVFDDTHPGWRDFSEDCLHANIYTPHQSNDLGPYPVMVWFYGGAYNSGGSIMYPGHTLATRDVIVVVPNYRVNHFGFAYTASDACPGNFGLWDQHAALQFVQDNIANFNGDPSRVTAFGQSAGAASTGLQMMSPRSQGLFHQGIMESGTEANFWSINWPEQTPENYIWEVAGKLDCGTQGTTPDQEMIDCLRLLPWEDVRGTSFRCTPGHYCLGMAPVVDDYTTEGFLPKRPLDLRAEGNIMDGPIIVGLNKDDASMYTVAMIPESMLGGYNQTMFQYYLKERLLSIWEEQMDPSDETTLDEAFESTNWNYAPWPYVNDEYQNREAFNKMITDAAFGLPCDRTLKDHHLRNPNTYGYIYDYRGRNATDYFPEWMGVPHQGELPGVWGWPLLPWNEQVRVDSGIFYDMINWTDEDRSQVIPWQTFYSHFAKTGNPSPVEVPNPVGEPLTWRPFTNDDTALIYVNNMTIEVRTLWEQQDYAFFREYLAWITEDYFIPFSTEDKRSGQKKEGLLSTWFDDVMDVFRTMRSEHWEGKKAFFH